MNSSCTLGSVQVENSKLKLENILSKNCSIFLLISAKIMLSILQQYRCHGNSGCPIGLVCIQNERLLAYSKSQKVSASYHLPFYYVSGRPGLNNYKTAVIMSATLDLLCKKISVLEEVKLS